MEHQENRLSPASEVTILSVLLGIFWVSLTLEASSQIVIPKDTTRIEPRLEGKFFGDHRFDRYGQSDELRFFGQHHVPYLPGETRVYEILPGVNITTTLQMNPNLPLFSNNQLVNRPRSRFAFDMNRLIGVPWVNPGQQWLVSPYFRRRAPRNPLRIDPRDTGGFGVRVIIVFPGH